MSNLRGKATKEQLELSSTVKEHHEMRKKKLVDIPKSEIFDQWKSIKEEENLTEYSMAMNDLSKKYWNKNIDNSQNRNFIIMNFIQNFLFEKNYLKFIRRFFRRNEMEIDFDVVDIDHLFLLDIGSCNNPLQEINRWDNLHILPIDMAPIDDVYKCDFLTVKLSSDFHHIRFSDGNNLRTIVMNEALSCKAEMMENEKNSQKLSLNGKRRIISEKRSKKRRIEKEIVSIRSRSFHVIIMSLFLDCLPRKEFRLIAVMKAQRMLVSGGVLVVVFPDSSRNPNKNQKEYNRWISAFETLCLQRIRMEKSDNNIFIYFMKISNKLRELRLFELSEIDQLSSFEPFSSNDDEMLRDFELLQKFHLHLDNSI
ncbi:hypothetical protein SNEBB_008832 [Seison nebaliae]|nr:hypothetical protein SNEBB_008832 [Seison nebaliae]